MTEPCPHLHAPTNCHTCFQSVVIVSHLPLISLFMSVLGIVAPEFFDHGESSLEAACREIDKWPHPVANQPLAVSIFGNELQVRPSSLSSRLSKLE